MAKAQPRRSSQTRSARGSEAARLFIALVLELPGTSSAGMLHNLGLVTHGNTVGGAFFVALACRVQRWRRRHAGEPSRRVDVHSLADDISSVRNGCGRTPKTGASLISGCFAQEPGSERGHRESSWLWCRLVRGSRKTMPAWLRWPMANGYLRTALEKGKLGLHLASSRLESLFSRYHCMNWSAGNGLLNQNPCA